MEKIPVNIILTKNRKNLSVECNLWYIPYCPYDIKNVDEWYNKIVTFINIHSDQYNFLHIPDALYTNNMDKENYIDYTTKPNNHIFIVGTGKKSSLLDLVNKVPEGYHVAYCLQKNLCIYKRSEDTETYVNEIIYDYTVKMMIYIVVILICLLYIFT